MSYATGLAIISSSVSAIWLVYLFLIRGIRFFGPNTDNQFLVGAAAHSNQWRWLSDLHRFSIAKTGMMDLTVIGIALFQKIFRDKGGDYPYIALGGFTAAISITLVYLVGANYWNPSIGLALSLLLMTSFWLWQIGLYGGHANTAALFFLLSVFIAQYMHNGVLSPLIWLFLASFSFGLTQFSSRSAIKYTPLFLAAVFYERHITSFSATGYSFSTDIVIPILVILLFLILKLSYKRAVEAMYFKRAPAFMNKVIAAQDKFPLEYYVQHANNKIKYYFTWAIRLLIFFLLAVHLLGLNYLLVILAGMFTVFFIFTLPNIGNSFKYFMNIFLETQIRKKSHFRLYVDYFAKKGIAVSRATQGGGWLWLPKIFFRMAPFHYLIYAISLTGLAVMALQTHGVSLANLIILTLLSLAPILWAQITGAPQLARTFSPGLISMLLIIGYFLSQDLFSLRLFILVAVIPTAIWNLWKFATDVYPARMTATRLGRVLTALKVKKLYTYDTEYNNNVVKMIDPKIMKDVKLSYAQSLSEVKSGWTLIPGTSSKAMHMSSERESIRDGDYTKDPILNELLETHRIEDIATAKFKALGTSNIWIHESEVASYRDIILKEVSKQDRFRGYAWLIHSSRLKQNLESRT